MTAKPPPIPKEQRALHDDAPRIKHPAEPKGDADLNLEQQGRHGNLHQNVETVHARTQDR